MQDIYRLMALVAVVEEGSFSAAVNRLHISQPALSARLKLLEDTMGCQLLERTSRGARPTAMGRMVYNIAVDILNRVEQLEKTVKNHIELGMGAVGLAGGSTAVHALLPRAMVAFRTLYPNIKMTLQECSSFVAAQMVCDGATDVAIVSSTVAAENPQLEVQGVVIDAYHLVAAHTHPLVEMAQSLKKIGKHLLPMHLNKQPMVLFDETSAIRKLIDGQFARLFIHPTVVMSLRTTQAMTTLVAKGFGLGVVSHWLFDPHMGLAVVPVEGLHIERELAIVTSKDHPLSAGARRFLDLLKEGVQKPPLLDSAEPILS